MELPSIRLPLLSPFPPFLSTAKQRQVFIERIKIGFDTRRNKDEQTVFNRLHRVQGSDSAQLSSCWAKENSVAGKMLDCRCDSSKPAGAPACQWPTQCLQFWLKTCSLATPSPMCCYSHNPEPPSLLQLLAASPHPFLAWDTCSCSTNKTATKTQLKLPQHAPLTPDTPTTNTCLYQTDTINLPKDEGCRGSQH